MTKLLRRQDSSGGKGQSSTGVGGAISCRVAGTGEIIQRR